MNASTISSSPASSDSDIRENQLPGTNQAVLELTQTTYNAQNEAQSSQSEALQAAQAALHIAREAVQQAQELQTQLANLSNQVSIQRTRLRELDAQETGLEKPQAQHNETRPLQENQPTCGDENRHFDGKCFRK